MKIRHSQVRQVTWMVARSIGLSSINFCNGAAVGDWPRGHGHSMINLPDWLAYFGTSRMIKVLCSSDSRY
jgi:hypothetical protein